MNAAIHAAVPPLAGQPVDSEGPVFAAPWQAQAFAVTLALHQRGVFTWPEWAHALSQEIARAQAAGDPDLGDTYYNHWLNALEKLLCEKTVSDAGELQRFQHAWDHAADRTPHGKPITLEPTDFADPACE